MMAKKIMAILAVVIFTFGVIGLAFAGEAITGKITKIEDKKLTIKADDKEVTVDVKSTSGLKAGDTVTVKDGEAKKKKIIEGC